MPFLRPRKMFAYNNSIAYCRINKCASTFSLETTRNIFNCRGETCDDIEKVIRTSVDMFGEVQNIVNEMYSFFFVREPYRRLFSTYSNKFYLPKEYWAPVGPQVVRRYRMFPSADSLTYGHDITFRELIQYTVDRFERKAKLDVHLRPMYRFCNPCFFNFTYIGTLETLDSDWNNMFSTWKKLNLVNVPNNVTVSDVYLKSHLPEIMHFYRSKETLKNSTIPVYNLFQRVWSYFQISGRISKHMALPYTREEVVQLEYIDFHRAVSDAIDSSKKEDKHIKSQRTDSLKQAYATIPKELLERLRNFVLEDCNMFGYDSRPDWLFGDDLANFKTDFDYFPAI